VELAFTNLKGEPAAVVFPIPFLTFFSKFFSFTMSPLSQTNQAAAPAIPPTGGNIIPLSPHRPFEGWLKNPAWIGEIISYLLIFACTDCFTKMVD
jgi:hypothetical protein